MDAWAKELLNYGVLGIIVLGVFSLLAWLAPRLIEAHIDFLNSTKACNEANQKVNVGVSETLRLLVDSADDQKKNCNRVSQTSKAIGHLADAAHEIVNLHPQFDRAAPHIKAAIHVLKSDDRQG